VVDSASPARRSRASPRRQLVITLVLLALVASQLGWWVYYIVRENRIRYEHELARLNTSGASAVERVRRELAWAQGIVDTAAWQATMVGEAPPAAFPFESFSLDPSASSCLTRWQWTPDTLTLHRRTGAGCLEAIASPTWVDDLLKPPAGLELRPSARSIPVEFPLPRPWNGWFLGPQEDVWEPIRAGYLRRKRCAMAEGTFFGVLLVVMLAIHWRTYRHEISLQQQHENFLSAVTHELKSPLASIRLALETILRGRADATSSMRFLGNALLDAERLQGLLEKVLEVTRYARGQGTIRLQHGCLSDVVEYSTRSFARRTMASGVQLAPAIAPDIWGPVDEEAFPIVVSNLLENAVKYGGTPPKVSVTLTIQGSVATLEVADNGSGIPDEDIGLVFNRFYRAGNEMTRTTEGTGLGLFLVDQIVRGHGGSSQIASTGPDGTVVRITLPHMEVQQV
jgi:signal transduction histidine kinase